MPALRPTGRHDCRSEFPANMGATVIKQTSPGVVNGPVPKPPPAMPWLAPLAVAAYGLRFGASWLLLQTKPRRPMTRHSKGCADA